MDMTTISTVDGILTDAVVLMVSADVIVARDETLGGYARIVRTADGWRWLETLATLDAAASADYAFRAWDRKFGT